jgi:pSer/pThr/pTyr-binding forkhead associated (FHA) protein
MAIRINIAEVDLRNHPGGLIIGRSAKSAMLIVRDDSVSRRHAAITQGEPLWLEDIGSSNGTRVNGVALVPNQKVMVTQGAEIEIGAVRLTLTRM